MGRDLIEEQELRDVDLPTAEKLVGKAAKQTLFFRMFPAYLLTGGVRFKGNDMRVFILTPLTHFNSGQVKLIPTNGGCRVVLEWARDNYMSRHLTSEFWDNLGRLLSVKQRSVLSTSLLVVGIILLFVVALISLYGIAIDYDYLHDPANQLETALGGWAMIMHSVTLAGVLLAGILALMRNWWSRGANLVLAAVFIFRLLEIVFYYVHSVDPLPLFEPIGVQFAMLALVFVAWICVGTEVRRRPL